MCSLAFMIQNITQMTLDRTISFVVTGVVALIELLIYCYSGDAVTSEGVEIAQAAYGMPWERWPVHLRRYVCVLMMRTQQPTVFQGLKMVTCSLTTYTTVSVIVVTSTIVAYSMIFLLLLGFEYGWLIVGLVAVSGRLMRMLKKNMHSNALFSRNCSVVAYELSNIPILLRMVGQLAE